ncbi:MAG: 50S ribosomal protein L4 [Candidatus Portnoybacteria bacterium CG02_land_8_20_14_3_00_45_8]|uniref:Large ribosomal subunit protein uL4 n=1 Tax=Candidatus Portnoybacteria bacterium CG02_land_8_20_14_3_00_45_8 TaxID=1974807 RepID=A0A2M7D619_9BACT|nr:MAG: 50S ribosomal protein L4 [Candidatus Portnoybacteria bacterium CG02_land_8_20_14_3_00_45_8]
MPVVKNTNKKAVVKEKAVKKEPVSLDMAVYGQDGKEVGKVNLPAEIFGLKLKPEVVRQAVQAQLANTRQTTAHAKDRSEVRGGGKRPWRQKGTGRARHASIRSPLWVGGGVTFGPRKEKNFARKINKKMKRQALLMVLSGKAKDKEIVLLDDLKLAEAKTKTMAEIIKQVAKGAKQNLQRGTLVVSPQNDQAVVRAARNIPKINTIGAQSLNIMDLMSVKYLLMPKAAIEVIKQIYGSAK